jgi:hypothetical protein
MTTAADDTADEAAFEAFLAGRPVPAEVDDGFPAVAAFAGAVRATATLPGRPSAALAELLATGLLTDQSSPSIRTAPSAGRTPRRSRIRRRRRFAMFFPALLAKFLSAGAVAQAASGAGIALVAFTGAGVAGVLPAPVQDTFSSVVGSETAADDTTVPADTTSTEDTTGSEDTTSTATDDGTDVEDPAVVTPEAPAATELTLEEWEQGPDPDQAFGDWVSSGASLGYADGATISKFAHERNADRKAGGTATATSAPEDESADDSDSSETESAETGSHGHGNSGHGNSGHGNSGHN